MNPTKPEFSGTFYDGKSANKYPVKLFLTQAQVELVFPDGRRISWLYPNLKISKTGSAGPVHLERATSGPNTISEMIGESHSPAGVARNWAASRRQYKLHASSSDSSTLDTRISTAPASLFAVNASLTSLSAASGS